MHSPDRARAGFGALLAREIGSVGLAVRREFAVAAGALALTLLLTGATAIRYHERLPLVPEVLLTTLPVALLLPWLVWKGDPPFGRAYLWTLPVRRHRAAAAKVAAGAVWLVLAMLLAFAMLAAMGIATGGGVGQSEVRLVGEFRGGGTAATPISWSTPLWMWLVPLGGALTAYVASSALLLGVRHPLRVVAAIAVAAALIGTLVANLAPHSPLYDGIGHVAGKLIAGRFGLDFLLTGGVASLSRDFPVPDGGSRELWTALPSAGRWAAALAVWFGAALIALALALRRHHER